MELKALERVLNDSKKVSVESGYLLLKTAVEDFLKAQPKAKPVDTKMYEEIVKKVKEMPSQACRYCGCLGAHFCTGKRPTFPGRDTWTPPFGIGTGIEYLSNQPTAISNFDTHPRRDEILAIVHGGTHGAQGIQLGKSFGASSSEGRSC